MGGLVAYVLLQVTAALKRAAVVYSFMAIAALIAIFAMGYALNAGYITLMFRYGAIAASLVIAGGLLGLAAACAMAGYIVSRRPRVTSSIRPASIDSVVHVATEPSQRTIALGAGLAATVAAVIVGLIVRRSTRSHRARTIDHD